MPLKTKFKVTETLHENNHLLVLRAIRLADKNKVVLKLVKPAFRNEQTVSQFANEERILSKLHSKNIIKLLDVLVTPTDYVHIFEDIGGTSLDYTLSNKSLNLQEKLEIALGLAKALQGIHSNGFIHTDVNPKNIIYNPHTHEVQLIDFGHTREIDHTDTYNHLHAVSSGSVFYMSPEQTGLTKRPMDILSDLYSFGMTLYYLFLGYIPIDSSDRYKLIHKQITLNPDPLHLLNKEIPLVISRIVTKLIQKKPQERYQSDEAIIYDITKAIKSIKNSGEISDFEIATHNQPNLNIGHQLFAREDELEVLEQVSEKANSPIGLSGFVSGQAGVGKTRLVKELLHLCSVKNIKTLNGEFDHSNNRTPYFGLKQVFSQLHTLCMTQREKKVITISERSAAALRLIFPELSDLLPLPVNRTLSSSVDTRSQLCIAVKELFENIATQEQPYLIFLDNLQWADSASIELLEESILKSKINYLHFIGAYRDNEISQNKNAQSFINKVLHRPKQFVFHIELSPFSKDDVEKMFITLFSSKTKKIKELSAIIHTKTGGNPFYIKTLLDYLIDDKELSFKKGKWDYSIADIHKYNTSINIAKLLNDKFTKLSQEKQKYLSYLALLGSSFDLDMTLTMMHNFGFDNTIIHEVHNDGYIYLHMNQYQFVHSFARENINKLIPLHDKQKIRFKIGKFLQHAYESNEYNNPIIIVGHLNMAYTNGNFPKYLFKLNLIALEQTLANNANQLALEQVKWINTHLFHKGLWKEAFHTAFEYKTLLVRTLYLNAQHDQAIEEIEELFSKARYLKEKILCFNLYKNICVTQGKGFHPLIKLANSLLNTLGLPVPNKSDDMQHEIDELQSKIHKHTLFKHPNKILQLPKVHKPKEQSIASLLIDYWEIAFYMADVKQMQWASLCIVYTSFIHGNTTESALGYVIYGSQLVSQKEYRKGYLFGKVALKLNHDLVMLPKINNFVANFINPYTRPLMENVTIYQKSLNQSRLNGDVVFGTWANFLMHFSNFLSGFSLEKVAEKITTESDFIKNSGDLKMIAIFDILVRKINNMQELDSITLFDEKSAIELWKKDNFYPALAWHAIIQAQECFLKASYDEGLQYLDDYVNLASNEVIMFPKIRLHFIRALLALGKQTPLNPKEKITLRLDLEEFDTYAKASPTNFKFSKLLLQAEQMKNKATAWDVIKIYDKAINEARRIKNPFLLALSSLCAGRFWKRSYYHDLSDFYFNEAISGLNQWGAYSIAKHVKSVLHNEEAKRADATEEKSVLPITNNNFQTLLAAFSTISKAKDTKKLIHDLMQIILQNATASKAVLILEHEGSFFTRASIDFKKQMIYDDKTPIEESTSIPKSLITYTINTGERIDIQRPQESGMSQSDVYIQSQQPASCLCLPTFLEDSIKGLLYLEQTEVHIPLDPGTLKTIELLLSQAVILYQNIALYESVKLGEENLNKAQEISHVGSWQFNTQNDKVIWSAETYRIYGLDPFSFDIDIEWFVSHLHPDDVDYVSKAVDKALSGQENYDVIHRIIIPNGQEKIVHQKGELLSNEGVLILSGTIQDITEAENSKATISRLSQVVDQNPFSTLITDENGFIVYTNKKTAEMTGYTHEELVGKKMNVFRSGSHSDEFYEKLWKSIKVDKTIWRGTLINKMKNGDLLDCESTIFPLFDSHEKIMNFVTIQDDATQRNIKEKLFLMQTRHAQMGEMISMIAHQWRQPLAIMTALMNKQRVDLALEQSNEEEIMRTYDELEDQIKHLSNTISDFRDFFKPDKEAIMTKSSIIISKSYTLIEHAFHQERIHVDFSYVSDKSYLTFEREMEQVILNLFKNAQDAFSDRKIKDPILKITCWDKDGYACISIEDNAKGIDQNVIDTLFLPYVSTKDQKQGTGLGLYMSKTIVEEHCKGSIDVSNTQEGARFIIRIPLHANQ